MENPIVRVPTIALLTGLALAPAAHAADPKGPTLDGFDYRKFIETHQKLVAEGKSKEAVDLIAKHAGAANLVGNDGGEELRKKFALIYGAGGKEDAATHEVAGYKRVTSRFYRFWAVSHFEAAAVTYVYTFYRTAAGERKLTAFGI